MPKRLLYYIPALLLICLFATGNHFGTAKPIYGIMHYADSIRMALPPQAAEKAFDSIYKSIQHYPNNILKRTTVAHLAISYGKIGALPKYEEFATKYYRLATAAKDTTGMAMARYKMGHAAFMQCEQERGYRYMIQAKNLFALKNDSLAMAMCQHYANYTAGNAIAMDIGSTETLRIFEKYNSQRLAIEASILLADNYSTTDKELCAYYYNRVLKKLDNADPNQVDESWKTDLYSTTYNNIGSLYFDRKNYKKAYYYFNKCLTVPGVHPYIQAAALANRAETRLNINKADKLALADITKALQITDSGDFATILPLVKYSEAQYYLMHDADTAQALERFKTAYDTARYYGVTNEALKNLKALTKYDTRNNRRYFGMYKQYSDSILQAERAMQDKFARIAYETETIRKQNRNLGRSINYTIAITVILVLLAGVIGLLVLLRAKNRKLEHLKQLQLADAEMYRLLRQTEFSTEKAKAEERKRVAMELHDSVINHLFGINFNLMQLHSPQEDIKQQLSGELGQTMKDIRRVSHELKNTVN